MLLVYPFNLIDSSNSSGSSSGVKCVGETAVVAVFRKQPVFNRTSAKVCACKRLHMVDRSVFRSDVFLAVLPCLGPVCHRRSSRLANGQTTADGVKQRDWCNWSWKVALWSLYAAPPSPPPPPNPFRHTPRTFPDAILFQLNDQLLVRFPILRR